MDELHLLIAYDINKIFSCNFGLTFQLCQNLTNDVVTHGILKTFHHWLAIIKIKSRGELCCNYDGQCIWQMVGW